MKSIIFNRLLSFPIAMMIIGGVLLGSGEIRAHTPTAEQTISGDSGSALENAQVETPGKAKKRKKKRKSKMVCKRERVTGTHMRQRVCRSQAEIDARREADQRMLDTALPTTTGSS